MVDRHIFLTGMPGSGKSHWAIQWSQAYGLPHADLDLFIETVSGKSIRQIFAEEGEVAFRRIEEDCLAQLVATLQLPAIIACGGGTVLSEKNRNLMARCGLVVYFKASTDTLLERLGADDTRPLLHGVCDLRSELQQMQAHRAALYEEAAATLDAAHLSIKTFEQIAQLCTDLPLSQASSSQPSA